ncbi:MAG: tetratricopeptide repeat protein [Candidatus Heimdallarchaeota archaeon]
MTLKTDKLKHNFTSIKNQKIIDLEQNLILDDTNSDLLKQLGQEHFDTGNYLRALNCFFKALSFEPKDASIWNKLAVVFIKLGNFSTAIDLSRIAYRLINQEQNAASS